MVEETTVLMVEETTVLSSGIGRWTLLPLSVPPRGHPKGRTRDAICDQGIALRDPGVSAGLAPERQQRSPNHDGANAGPDRNVDRLLVLDRQLKGAHLCLVGLLGVAE